MSAPLVRVVVPDLALFEAAVDDRSARGRLPGDRLSTLADRAPAGRRCAPRHGWGGRAGAGTGVPGRSASEDDELRDIVSVFWSSRFALAAPMIERAVVGRELWPDVDAHEIVERLVSPLYFCALVSGEPLDETLRSSVEAALCQARGNAV